MPNGDPAPRDWWACPGCRDPLHAGEYCTKCGVKGEKLELIMAGKFYRGKKQ